MTALHCIAEMKADSDAIVRVQETDRTQTKAISGLPFTITDVHVTEVVRGTWPSAIRIRQTDTGGVGGDDILKPGSSYRLFLERFARDGHRRTRRPETTSGDGRSPARRHSVSAR
ncbi:MULTISPECIES: hypothetical protein [Frankia]|uniref:Uncharacterized protein n=1 Tax=Frankia alni (strain DSM 45986 / CECT 9034 / ACN14a) TaxID=326424 RepID=Q0RTZ2_FRAAA|nr:MULTISPECIES: hypothetical protein [Frankia]CAJ58953.1 hypothetical protein FRAAL0276 [Frankia alni ACN14a]